MNSGLPEIYRKFFREDFHNELEPAKSPDAEPKTRIHVFDRSSMSKRTWTIEANVAKKRTKIRGWSNMRKAEDQSSIEPSVAGSQPDMGHTGMVQVPNANLRRHQAYVEKMLVKGREFNRTMKYGFPLVSRKTTQTSN